MLSAGKPPGSKPTCKSATAGPYCRLLKPQLLPLGTALASMNRGLKCRELRGAAEAFSSKQRVAQEACDRLEAENRASSAETAELARRLAEATRAIAALEASARGSEAALLAAEARAGRAAQESADHAETSKALRHSLSALEEKVG